MKIAFFEINNWEAEILRKKFKKHKLLFYSTPLDETHIKDISDCDIISVFIYSKINEKILNQLPKLKLVITRSTGYDHIDCKACGKRKVLVCNVPYYGENTVAEHAFALILSLARKVHKSYMKDLASDFSIDELKGFDLKGKTLGVVGTGHIGRHTIKIAKGFDMQVIAFDHHKDQKIAKELGFKYSTLNNLLKKSDIVSLHVPSTKENYHIINSNSLKLLKKSAIIINTARGELIDTKALLNALEANNLAGAGLDVIEGEFLLKEHHELSHNSRKEIKRLSEELSLIRNEKVVFTPHIAFFSQEALERILNTTIDEIEYFIKNKPINLLKNV